MAAATRARPKAPRRRARITATGDQEMSRLTIHSPGGGIVRALATLYGTIPDDRGLWAEVNLERTT